MVGLLQPLGGDQRSPNPLLHCVASWLLKIKRGGYYLFDGLGIDTNLLQVIVF